MPGACPGLGCGEEWQRSAFRVRQSKWDRSNVLAVCPLASSLTSVLFPHMYPGKSCFVGWSRVLVSWLLHVKHSKGCLEADKHVGYYYSSIFSHFPSRNRHPLNWHWRRALRVRSPKEEEALEPGIKPEASVEHQVVNVGIMDSLRLARDLVLLCKGVPAWRSTREFTRREGSWKFPWWGR